MSFFKSFKDTASSTLKKQAGTFTDLSLDYSFLLDNRDRSFMPTKGTFATFSQTLPIFADSPSVRNTVQYNRYNSFNEDMIGAFKFYAAGVVAIEDDVRLSRRLHIPSKRLRGFENRKIGPVDGGDYIGGNYATVLNLEAALPNLLPESTRTDVSLFLDSGNLWGVDYDSSIDENSKIRSSTGLAVEWFTPVGPLSLSYAIPLTKSSTDKTETVRFNIGTTF